ncbi:MAG TPA: formate dehydrogenase subunit gamma [Candidatus Dormibacteraeota bacterium]|nr:formate dehydrogenase subunit gamma [Candidatus Dormibacteraeota bacterium]
MTTTRTTMKAADSAHSAHGILRYTITERVNHWLGALFYVYVLLTGLAFWSPNLFWIATMLGGGETSRYWHPWAGVLFAISMAVMYSHWRQDMRETEADRKWRASMGHYVRNEDQELPPVGRFNYGQKLFFWVMLWAVAALLVSGFGLWNVDLIPWSLRWLRYAAVLVHVVAALITIGAFIIHVYMGTAMVRGGFSSIIRGVVTPAWARTHHRLWYEQQTGQSDARSHK